MVGRDAMQFGGWQRLNAEYAKQFGVEPSLGPAQRPEGLKRGRENMKRPVPVKSASPFIDQRIRELGDWRGKTLAKVRQVIHEADPEIVEEWKWMGTPTWYHDGIVCTGETYKNVVKMTFAKGLRSSLLQASSNSSLDGNVRRAIDIHEGEEAR